MKVPNIFRFLTAVFRSIYARLAGFEVLVPAEIEEKRLDTCFTCPFFDENLEQCKICGCYARAKAILALEKCPIGKWNAVWRKRLPTKGSSNT